MSDETTVANQEIEEQLRQHGIAIVSENPEHKVGELTRYRVVGKLLGSDDEFEALGDDRTNALNALVVVSKAL